MIIVVQRKQIQLLIDFFNERGIDAFVQIVLFIEYRCFFIFGQLIEVANIFRRAHFQREFRIVHRVKPVRSRVPFQELQVTQIRQQVEEYFRGALPGADERNIFVH